MRIVVPRVKPFAPIKSFAPSGLALLMIGSVGLSSACGSGGSPMEPEPPAEPPTEPPTVLTGRVVASDTFRVHATTDQNTPFEQFSTGGTLPADIGPTAGKILVLALRDLSRPTVACTGGLSDSNCAVMDVPLGTDEGFIQVELASGRRNFYLQSTLRLDLVPDPA